MIYIIHCKAYGSQNPGEFPELLLAQLLEYDSTTHIAQVEDLVLVTQRWNEEYVFYDKIHQRGT
jgi:hypothetical protein